MTKWSALAGHGVAMGGLAKRGLYLAMAAVLLVGCADQRIRDDARTKARSGNYEQAVNALRAGLVLYPDSDVLRAGLVETQTDASTYAVNLALRARAQGDVDGAEKGLLHALAVAPDDSRLRELLAQVTSDRQQRSVVTTAEGLVARHKNAAALDIVNEGLKSNPKQVDLLALKRRLEVEQRAVEVRAAHLGLSEVRPISLDFRDANLRAVLDAISRSSGVSFVLDKDIRSDTKVTVYLRSVKTEDAIDLITSTNQLTKKIIDSRTILIYPNTPEKQHEYQEQIVRVFYLSNADAKGASAFIKSMLKIREPFVDERTNMLSIRDTQENLALVERLVALYDAAEPEVLLELDVIEINTTRLTELGIQFPDTFSLTPLPPFGQIGLTLGNITTLNRDRIGLSVGGITVNLNRQTGDFDTLANPRVRVKNREKAHILVGDKIPIVTTTLGSTGFVSDSVNYIDVGLKLEIEPTIYIDDDVGIKVALEVSTLGNQSKTGSGTIAYQIGTRNASTTLRLHDGERQLLAGLINRQSSNTANKVPGLGDIPIAGRLFSSQIDNSQRVELVLSITPHVLRNIRRPDASESEMWVGTEALPRLRPAGGVIPSVEEPMRISMPGAATQLTGDRGAVAPSTDLASPTQAAAGIAALLEGPAQVRVGETFSLSLGLESSQALRGAPIELTYAKDRLQLLDIQEGDLFKQGNGQTGFTQTIDGTEGKASIGVISTAADGAVGKGTVAILRFKATSSGPAEVGLLSVKPVGLAGPVALTKPLPMLKLQVQ